MQFSSAAIFKVSNQDSNFCPVTFCRGSGGLAPELALKTRSKIFRLGNDAKAHLEVYLCFV
jgi:hypothetical protein